MSSTESRLMPVPQVGGTQRSPTPPCGPAMHNGYGRILCFVFRRLFEPVDYPAEAAERLRDLSRQGTIVYVARAHTGLAGLYFNHTLARLDLPLARFVGGINLALWQPVQHLWKWLRSRWRWWDAQAVPPRARLLCDSLVRGEPAFLFLRPWSQRRARVHHDYLQALIAAQRQSERPIYVVPHVLVNRSQGGIVRSTLGSRIFGEGRRNNRWREIITLIFVPGYTTVRVADAIDLRPLIAGAPEADDGHLARRLAHEVNRAIDDEERVVAGPNLPSFEVTKRHVLRHPLVRHAIETLGAKATVKDLLGLERRAERLLHEVAARYSTHYVRFMSFAMRLIFSRIYDGIIVDEAGLTRVLDASRKGPIVFCPSHKSHVDYLVLSYMLWEHGVTPPHIAAGANLSFFPLGSIFRRAGAFFLRRTFRGDDLYRAVFRSYVTELVRTGTSIEFFLEGTRSRSGKLAAPKLGLLSMLVDAWRTGARSDLQFVPVSIDYERVIEAGSYERELLGASKKSEDLGALLRSTKVLRSRYGRVHVQFGAPVSLAALAATRELAQSDDPNLDEAWRRETERLGYRILHDVSQCCMVTPIAVAATALLGHRGRGLAQGLFLTIGEAVCEYLESSAARLSDALRASRLRGPVLLQAVQKLVAEGSVQVDHAGRGDSEPIYRVREEARMQLDFHKNAVMNYFAPASIMARAIGHRGGGAVTQRDVYSDARFLSRLFKREFLFRVDTSYTTHFDDALATLAARGLLDVQDDGTVVVREPATIAHLAGMLDSFIEAYWIVIQTLADLHQFPLWDKELALRARERARRCFLEGGIRSPEAASRTLIESALDWTLETGVLEVVSDGRQRRLQLSSAYEGDKLKALTNEVASYL